MLAPRDHAAVHRRRVHARARRPDRRALPGAVPDRRAARAQRPRGRDPQRARPLHDPGDRAAGLEPRDHRGARRAHAAVRRRRTGSTPTRSASLAGTLVQLADVRPALRRIGYPAAALGCDWRDARVGQVLRADAAGDARPRADQHRPAAQLGDRLARLRRRRRARSTPPSASTCSRRACSPSRSRPCCSRRSAGSPRASDLAGLRATTGTGMRQIALLLIPARRIRSRSPTPIVRLVYQRGEFDAQSTDLVARGAVLVRVHPAVHRHQPAAHAHVLLAPAAVAADGAGRSARSCVNAASRSRSTSRWASPASCSARWSPTRS